MDSAPALVIAAPLLDRVPFAVHRFYSFWSSVAAFFFEHDFYSGVVQSQYTSIRHANDADGATEGSKWYHSLYMKV